jgi:D-alanyl-D-alanine-carboxypeptidase/D-alanyl-D-alanine-endopeptidase
LLSSLAFALALTLAPRPHAPAQVPAQTPALPDLQTAEALGQNLFLKSGSTGMVMVVVRDNKSFFRGYGETAPGSAQVPTQTSLLRLCSLSKIFASDLLVKLMGDKLVRLDDPLQKFAPSKAVKVPAKPGHPITLADLATHTSGLPREVGRAPHGTPHFTFPGYEYRWHWLPRQILKSVPGTEALYSNVGFDLLGDALEKAAHKSYATLLYERTTQPLGMAETGFTPSAAQCQRLLQGAHDEGPCTDTQNSAGSSGLYSTAADMTIWLKYLLSAQNPAAQAVYIEPATLLKESGLDHAGKPTGIGLGWMHIAASDGSDITEKTGGGAGFVTYIAIDKTRRTALFVAVTDGAPNPNPAPATESHLNFFGQANNLLLAVDGLPPLPPEPPKPVRKAKPAAKKVVKRKRPA